jgi:hypothetical protein
MSDTENTQIEETPTQTEEVTSENPTPNENAASTGSNPRGNHRGRDGARPPRGDKRWRGRDGMREEEKEFQEEMLSVDRVTRVTAGWRQIRFRASVVVGDGKGRIGLGTGKAWEVQSAIEKAIRDAKKNLITFPIVNGTIPHDVAVNFKRQLSIFTQLIQVLVSLPEVPFVRYLQFLVSRISSPNNTVLQTWLRMLVLPLKLLRLSNLRAWISIFHQKSHPLRLPK